MRNAALAISVPKPHSSTAVELCNQILVGAVEAGASYVHVEPATGGLQVRYRVGSALSTVMTVPAKHAGAVRNRFKSLSRTKVSEKRRPQDGAFMVRVNGRPVGVELSTAPTIAGEKVVMRVMDMRGDSIAVESPVDYAIGASQIPGGTNVLQLATGSSGTGAWLDRHAGAAALRSQRRHIRTQPNRGAARTRDVFVRDISRGHDGRRHVEAA